MRTETENTETPKKASGRRTKKAPAERRVDPTTRTIIDEVAKPFLAAVGASMERDAAKAREVPPARGLYLDVPAAELAKLYADQADAFRAAAVAVAAHKFPGARSFPDGQLIPEHVVRQHQQRQARQYEADATMAEWFGAHLIEGHVYRLSADELRALFVRPDVPSLTEDGAAVGAVVQN